MRGDKLVIRDVHRKAAKGLVDLLLPSITKKEDRFVITIAGESGSGKSEIAAVLAELLDENRIKSVILQQDDYFVHPPRTNERMRRDDRANVGIQEVRLDILNRNLMDILSSKDTIKKPLVLFDDDKITEESIDITGVKVVIVEGTYTTVLDNVDCRVFIDRTYMDTRESRELRAREKQDDFLENVLNIEHQIISSHKSRADIIITKNYDVMEMKKYE